MSQGQINKGHTSVRTASKSGASSCVLVHRSKPSILTSHRQVPPLNHSGRDSLPHTSQSTCKPLLPFTEHLVGRLSFLFFSVPASSLASAEQLCWPRPTCRPRVLPTEMQAAPRRRLRLGFQSSFYGLNWIGFILETAPRRDALYIADDRSKVVPLKRHETRRLRVPPRSHREHCIG